MDTSCGSIWECGQRRAGADLGRAAARYHLRIGQDKTNRRAVVGPSRDMDLLGVCMCAVLLLGLCCRVLAVEPGASNFRDDSRVVVTASAATGGCRRRARESTRCARWAWSRGLGCRRTVGRGGEGGRVRNLALWPCCWSGSDSRCDLEDVGVGGCRSAFPGLWDLCDAGRVHSASLPRSDGRAGFCRGVGGGVSSANVCVFGALPRWSPP